MREHKYKVGQIVKFHDVDIEGYSFPGQGPITELLPGAYYKVENTFCEPRMSSEIPEHQIDSVVHVGSTASKVNVIIAILLLIAFCIGVGVLTEPMVGVALCVFSLLMSLIIVVVLKGIKK